MFLVDVFLLLEAYAFLFYFIFSVGKQVFDFQGELITSTFVMFLWVV